MWYNFVEGKCAQTIKGEIYKVWALGDSLMPQFLVELKLLSLTAKMPCFLPFPDLMNTQPPNTPQKNFANVHCLFQIEPPSPNTEQ